MLKQAFYLLLLIVVISCGNDDVAPPPIQVFEENPITPPEIGIKRFGKAGSNEVGKNIYDTNEGFVSFEYADLKFANTIANGQFVIRRLDEKLITIDSTIIVNDPFIIIKDVERFGVDVYAVIGNMEPGGDAKPIITLFNKKGEELKSIIVSDFLTKGGSGNARISNSYFINNKLYLVLFENSSRTIVAFDTELNLLWEKNTTSENAYSTITVDANHIYTAYSTSISGESFNIVSVEQLDIESGEKLNGLAFTYSSNEIKSKSYPTLMLNDDENVYLVFQAYFSNNSNVSGHVGIKKINKTTLDVESHSLQDVRDYYDFELLNDGFIYSGYFQDDKRNIVKTDKSFNEIWSYTVLKAKVMSDILEAEDGSFPFSGSYSKGKAGNSDLFDDVLCGILRPDGTLK